MKRINMGMSGRGWGSKLLALAVAGALLLQPFGNREIGYANSTTAGPAVELVSEEPVTAGAVIKKYVWRSTRSGTPVSANANVIEVDLLNPHVKLDVVTGKGNQFAQKETVVKMAKETQAAAAVNGDFFNTQAEGAPFGAQVSNGQFMASAPYIAGMYAFALTSDNKPIIDAFTFKGNVYSESGAQYPLSGINKAYYYMDPGGLISHSDTLHIYTSAWGSQKRALDVVSKPTEVLVQNGMIMQISDKAPLPMVPPKDGYILWASGKAAEFVRTNLQVGGKLSYDYETSAVDQNRQYDTKSFRMMIGGHTMMVDEGQPSAFSRNVDSLGGYRARTGLGYSQDGRTVYLITVDRSDGSEGMTMKEFQQFMVLVGVWKGLNLDGGGSTQMAARPLGEFDPKLANETEYGTERKVVNGLAVYSIAPQGNMKGMLLQGETVLFLKEKAAYTLKAYDEYYNPIRLEEPRWSVSAPLGSFEGNQFIPVKFGTASLTAAVGDAQQSIDVEVVGKSHIADMQIQGNPDAVLTVGGTYKLPVSVTTKSGKTRTVPPELVEWEFIGIDGSMNGDILTVKGISGRGMGQLIARYDRFSTMIALSAGVDKTFADFDKVTFPIQFEGYPSKVVTGEAKLLTGVQGLNGKSNVLGLSYDFTQGGAITKAAYAYLGEKGRIEGDPQYMKLNLLGDGSLNWLRAEVFDANGKEHRIDLVKTINFTGWKEIAVDLAPYKLVYPVTLKRFYIRNQDPIRDEHALTGSIAIDDVKFQYKGTVPPITDAKVQMAVNRKTITVNGQTVTLDTAPVLREGHTLIPVRFFVDALGGSIDWDPKERKVTILRGAHLIECWIEDSDVIVDGKALKAPIAPTLLGGRTVLPLRMISEKLGWKVSWDALTSSIVLE